LESSQKTDGRPEGVGEGVGMGKGISNIKYIYFWLLLKA